MPVPNSDMVQVKSIDIFTPLVDEPEIMGEISACNVTNDIFAMNDLEYANLPADTRKKFTDKYG